MTQRGHTPPAALPASAAEMAERGWDCLDLLLVTGDAYVDHPAFGAALIGRVLETQGLRVGIIAQPDWRTPESLAAMGRPRLFCGVTAGNLDSMVANYTAARHRRREDEYGDGGTPRRRPPPATERRLNDTYKPAVRQFARQYSNQLLEAIDWCMQFHQLDRPQTVQDLLDFMNPLRMAEAEPAAAEGLLARLGVRLPWGDDT